MIVPTPGRVVWFRPHANDRIYIADDVPLAAIVTRVWSDTCVNLAVFDGNGVAHSRCSALLWQEGNPLPAANYAEWMPYQKGQAAKTEALELGLVAQTPIPREERPHG